MTRPRKKRGDMQEKFTKMLLPTMREPAWRALSPTAQALYPWIKLEWRGEHYNNNGSLRLSTRQAAEKIGVSVNAAARAFHDLQAKGFLIVTERACLGTEGMARSPAYELTEIPLPGAMPRVGKKLYKSWRPEQDFFVVVHGANNPEGRNGKTKPRHHSKDEAIIDLATKKASLSSR